MQVTTEPIQGNVVPDQSSRKRVLVFTGSYLPGYKYGGPIRSVANIVNHLCHEFDFYIATRDRDATDTEPYEGIVPDRWYQVGGARVLYCSSFRPSILLGAIADVEPDLIVLNSFLDSYTIRLMLLRRFGKLVRAPVLLTPRGEFSPGALSIKPAKKTIYRGVAKLFGLFDRLLWQATAAREKQEILDAAPAWKVDPDSIYVAHNICEIARSTTPRPEKHAGEVKLVFISRINVKKNLHFILDALGDVRGNVHLSIFGPIADYDAAYWEKCRALLNGLPGNIQAEYKGSLDHSDVPRVLHEHHFFVLPTLGENYCHAAVESFVNGTPVVMSDETPWVDLDREHAGFDIPLSDRKGWVDALKRCVEMDQQTYAQYLKGTLEYSMRFAVEDAVRQHRVMFQAAIETGSGSKDRR
jgi:glycosyltransferase involved in cell wall biosynthesis